MNIMDSSVKFYFQQNFRNQQIKTIYNIIQLPKTKENNNFINNLLIQNNKELFNFYYNKKPSFINPAEFLKKLGNKCIVETVKQILFIIRQKEQEEKEIKQQQEERKQEIEEIDRPKFTNYLNNNNEDPEKILTKVQEERLKFDQSLPSYKAPKKPEDVGLTPISTSNNKESTNKTDNNEIKSNNKFNQQDNQQIPDNLAYKSDDFDIKKPKENIDFSKPIDQSLLMPDMNAGEDTNYSPF